MVQYEKGIRFHTIGSKCERYFYTRDASAKSGLKRLLPGQKVRFEIYDDKGRPAAENVEIINQ